MIKYLWLLAGCIAQLGGRTPDKVTQNLPKINVFELETISYCLGTSSPTLFPLPLLIKWTIEDNVIVIV